MKRALTRDDVIVGNLYLWTPDGETVARVVTARRHSQFWPNTVRIDDGDPRNPDLAGNGFRVSAWVDTSELSELNK